MTLIRHRLLFIVLAFLAVGVSYVLATPPLESSDEYKHYPVVQHIQTSGRLVTLDPEDPGLWLQEGAQPPLYYLLMAWLTAAVDTGDLAIVHQVNPHAFVGDPNQIRNKNLILHDPARLTFPGTGTVLAVTIIRLASLLLGAATLTVIYRLGTHLFTPTIGLLAAGLTAFTPMVLFIHAAVNNDSLAVLLGTLGLYGLVRLWQHAGKPTAHRLRDWQFWLPYVALGGVLGAAMLTKLSLAALVGLAGLALAWQAWRQRRWTIFFVGGPALLATALAVSGWWLARNLALYGDITGLNVFIAVQGMRADPITWADWVAEFGTFYRTYWGLFGGVNIAAPEWFYLACNIMAVTGGSGLLLAAWRSLRAGRLRRRLVDDGLWLLAVWSLIMLLLLLRWTIIYPAFQGRLIFPALGALHLLWARGLIELWPGVAGRRLAWAAVGGLFVMAVLLPWTHIAPAYAFPQPLTEVPAADQIEPILFQAANGQLALVGVAAEAQSTEPAGRQPIEITLYWTAIEPVATNYLTSVHALGRSVQSVGQSDRYPGWGMTPTSRWRTGQIWRDEYRVFINASAEAPARLRMSVSVLDVARGHTLPAADAFGNPLELLLVGPLMRLAAVSAPPAPATRLAAAFGDNITLDGYSMPATVAPGATLPVTLTWSAGNTPSTDYTVFVHLLDADGTMLANGDAPPILGDYPTSLWRAGDTIVDVHRLALADDLLPGTYRILVGLYDPQTLTRLPGPDGTDSVSWFVTVEAP